jgi:hypothetical protein
LVVRRWNGQRSPLKYRWNSAVQGDFYVAIPSEAFPIGTAVEASLSSGSFLDLWFSLLFTNNQFSGYQMRPRFHLEELPQTFPPIFHKSLILSDMGFMRPFPAGPFGTEPNVADHEIQAYLSPIFAG